MTACEPLQPAGLTACEPWRTDLDGAKLTAALPLIKGLTQSDGLCACVWGTNSARWGANGALGY
jgi:hypothetical protein